MAKGNPSELYSVAWAQGGYDDENGAAVDGGRCMGMRLTLPEAVREMGEAEREAHRRGWPAGEAVIMDANGDRVNPLTGRPAVGKPRAIPVTAPLSMHASQPTQPVGPLWVKLGPDRWVDFRHVTSVERAMRYEGGEEEGVRVRVRPVARVHMDLNTCETITHLAEGEYAQHVFRLAEMACVPSCDVSGPPSMPSLEELRECGFGDPHAG